MKGEYFQYYLILFGLIIYFPLPTVCRGPHFVWLRHLWKLLSFFSNIHLGVMFRFQSRLYSGISLAIRAEIGESIV